MMKPFTCVRCIMTVGAVSMAVSGQACPPGKYRDSRTGNCNSCETLCQSIYEHVPGTVNDCSKNCPDYAKVHSSSNKIQCEDGYYYDVNLNKCDACFNVCEHHEIRGTSSDCKYFCPNEYARFTTSSGTTATPPCTSDSYYDSNISRCSPCSTVCDEDMAMGTTADCKHYCPEVFKARLVKEESQEGNNYVIVLVCAVGGVIAAVIGLVVVALQCYRKHRANKESTQDTAIRPNHRHVPHPTVAYVSCPIHVQCVEGCISESPSIEILQNIDDDRSGIAQDQGSGIAQEENQKFPEAYADLPYSARPVSSIYD